MFKKAAKNIKDAQKKQKDTYDRKHLPELLAVGTKVMVENTAQKEIKGGKLDRYCLPTFIILIPCIYYQSSDKNQKRPHQRRRY